MSIQFFDAVHICYNRAMQHYPQNTMIKKNSLCSNGFVIGLAYLSLDDIKLSYNLRDQIRTLQSVTLYGYNPPPTNQEAPTTQEALTTEEAPTIQEELTIQKEEAPTIQKDEVLTTQEDEVLTTQKEEAPTTQKEEAPTTQEDEAPELQTGSENNPVNAQEEKEEALQPENALIKKKNKSQRRKELRRQKLLEAKRSKKRSESPSPKEERYDHQFCSCTFDDGSVFYVDFMGSTEMSPSSGEASSNPMIQFVNTSHPFVDKSVIQQHIELPWTPRDQYKINDCPKQWLKKQVFAELKKRNRIPGHYSYIHSFYIALREAFVKSSSC